MLAADGSRTRTVEDLNGDGSLRDKTVTTASANAKSISIARDFNGDGNVDETETIVTGANGSTVDTVSVFAATGALFSKEVTTTDASGLNKTVQDDVNGDGTFDTVITDDAVINADGSRTETITDEGANQTVSYRSVATVSASGLATTTKVDHTGTGTFDTVTTDTVTLNTNGSRTETIADTNANGSLRDQSTIVTSADRMTETVTRDTNGDGVADQVETKAVQSNGSIVDTVADYSGTTLAAKFITTDNANGLVQTKQYDFNGDGTVDLTISDVTYLNFDGSRTETITSTDAAGHLIDQTQIITSANGLSITTEINSNGGPRYNYVTTDVTTFNSDGSRNETVATHDSGSLLLDQAITQTSQNGLSISTNVDLNGDGVWDRTDSFTEAADRSTSTTVARYDYSGTLLETDITNTSADGRTTSYENHELAYKAQNDGNGAYTGVDRFRTVALDAIGNATDTRWDQSSTGSITEKIVTAISVNGLSSSSQLYLNGDTTADVSRTSATVINADGTRTETYSETAGSGTLDYRSVTTTAANGLSVTKTFDLNGDGTIDETETIVTTINADGSKTTVDSTYYSDATLKERTTTAVSADRLSSTTSVDSNGDGALDRVSTVKIGLDGSRVETTTYYNASGGVTASSTETIADAGQLITVSRSNGSQETTSIDNAVNGSYVWSSTANGITITSAHTIDAAGVDHWMLNNPAGLANGGTYSVSLDAFTKDADFAIANRIYDTVFDRDMSRYDQEELAQYLTTGGFDELRLVKDLLNSSEFAQRYGSSKNFSDTDFIMRMYENALGRDPSLSELSHYLSAMGDGPGGQGQNTPLTRAGVALTIAESSEHIYHGNGHAVTNNTDTGNPTYTLDHTIDKAEAAALVARLIDVAFDRDPTANEIATYSSALLNGSETEAQIAGDILSSGNGLVCQLFVNAFNRLPTLQEENTWSNYGMSRGDLLLAIADSEDHLGAGNVHSTAPLAITISGLTVAANGRELIVGDGITVGVDSSSNTILLGSNDTLWVGGTSNVVNASGSGDSITEQAITSITINMSHGTLTANNNSTVSLNGSSDTIYAQSTGSGITMSVTGSNNTIFLQPGISLTVSDSLGSNVINGSQSSGALTVDLNSTLAGVYSVAGSPYNDTLTAENGLNDVLSGGTGTDLLIVRGGSDTLTGGAGVDTFRFAEQVGQVVTSITDFVHGTDVIQLDRAIFSGIGNDGTLPAGNFHIVTSPPAPNTGINYEPSNGYLYKGATHFATLPLHLSLANTDFILVN